MAMADAKALGTSLVSFCNLAQDLGNNYFRADAAWKGFPARVKLLQDKHELWTKKLEEYGLNGGTFQPLHEAVEEAKKMLDGEISKLEKKKLQKCRGFCGVIFRESVETHMAAVERAFRDISAHLEAQLQDDDLLRQTALRQRNNCSLPFATDKRKRYVRLEQMEKRISDALEGAGEAPAVVLLCGEAGKGKSTLAREVSLRYAVGNSTVSRVVMVECGPKINVAAKKRQLLQQLGGDLTLLPQPHNVDAGASPKSTREELNKALHKALQVHLTSPRLLIYLDDLWNREFIDTLVNLSGSGPGAKYLITSQLVNICEESNCQTTVIPIDDLSKSDAIKILASHAKFEDQKIPLHLQDAADKIIDQAHSNPLVIATLGAKIQATGKEKFNEKVWEDVSGHLYESLRTKARGKVHGVGYKETFVATMKISCDALSDEQRNILVLLGMCEGPLMFKAALQLLYNALFSKEICYGLEFLQSMNDLQNRSLVFENDSDYLSVHSLTKRFVRHELKQEVDFIRQKLKQELDFVRGVLLQTASLRQVRGNVDARLHGVQDVHNVVVAQTTKHPYRFMISVLIYQYIDLQVQKGLFSDSQYVSLGLTFGNVNSETGSKIRSSMSSTLELVVKLEPTKAAQAKLDLLSLVLLEFIAELHIDQDGILELLASPNSKLLALTFLENLELRRLDELFIFRRNRIRCFSG